VIGYGFHPSVGYGLSSRHPPARLIDMAVEQLMGWGLTTLAVLGFSAIGLVAVWPR